MAGLEREVWKSEVLKHFRPQGTHFEGLSDYSSDLVNGVALHLTALGIDPNLLVNNTSYPIATAVSVDNDVVLTIDKLETENTAVPDDELKNIAYPKVKLKAEQHKDVLMLGYMSRGTHGFAPATNTTDTPVIETTGDVDPDNDDRRKMIPKDIKNLKKKFDKLNIPKEGRRLVLCPDHISDLLDVDQKFEKQYNTDHKDGRVGFLYGFKIYEYTDMPIYAGGTKKAYGAAQLVTDAVASIAFYAKRGWTATGKITEYGRDAKDDPENRQTTIGFRLYAMAAPKKNTGEGAAIGAIISGF